MKYIIREGTKRGEGLYWTVRNAYGFEEWGPQFFCFEPSERDEARDIAVRVGGRVVRLLSHEEAKRKAAAMELLDCAKAFMVRAHARRMLRSDRMNTKADTYAESARALRERAEELWPAKGGAK